LIFGVSGQDGRLLAQLLFERGYEVHGTSRDGAPNSLGIHWLPSVENLHLHLHLHQLTLTDSQSVLRLIDQVSPDEIYNLAGLTSVSLSFEQPVEAFESISRATINILECIRILKRPVRFYNAASTECFGNTAQPADELTSFQPRSPYALAKAAAFWAVKNYRESYGIFASSGILSNHESPLRSERFVTQKIVTSAVRIAGGAREKLRLGNLATERDWGWAPEYVEAMPLILNHSEPTDFIIASGQSHSLLQFVEKSFSHLNLDWRDHVVHDNELMRPADVNRCNVNPTKAHKILGWKTRVRFDELVSRLVNFKLKKCVDARREIPE
jgi:GDPmannose 4,6-dehydratase